MMVAVGAGCTRPVVYNLHRSITVLFRSLHNTNDDGAPRWRNSAYHVTNAINIVSKAQSCTNSNVSIGVSFPGVLGEDS